MTLTLRYAARSDVGLIREGNEDSGYAGPALLLVADGMGGHAAGELASAIAVATVADLDMQAPDTGEVLSALASSVADVGEGISEVIADDPDHEQQRDGERHDADQRSEPTTPAHPAHDLIVTQARAPRPPGPGLAFSP